MGRPEDALHGQPSKAGATRWVFLALGSNVGDRLANLQAALAYLQRQGKVAAVSGLYLTRPSGVADQPQFLNACCALITSLALPELLRAVKQVEWDLGRRPSLHWGPRPIDIDILLDGETICETPALVVPHPRLAERGFVLAPLLDIAAGVVHPLARETVRELWLALSERERESVEQLSDPEWAEFPP
ncbi:MAG: 2-amino-4-hydroxy-6-hydroxymethyldihydropteridine diphosphokinase [Dehalococcoidia bacterium]